MIGEAKPAVYLINQTHHAFDFIRNLIPRHEDMRIILRKAAHPHQSMQLA